MERLSLEPGAVNLAELIGGPVLDAHDRFSGVRAILGVVETAAVNGTRGVATLRFSTRDDVRGVVADVAAGIIRSVSAGYTVQKWQVEKRADGVRIKTAVKWTPKEVSLVAFGADPAAKIRSQERQGMERTEQIRSIAAAVGVVGSFVDDLLQRDVSVDEARGEIIRHAAAGMPAIDSRQPSVTVTRGSDDNIERMADGIRTRINPAHRPEAGREFSGFGWSDVARRCLEGRGLSTLGSRVELITRAMHTTSDFGAVLAEVFNKELLVLRQAPSPVEQIFRRATADDFRARHIMEISDGSDLAKVNEKGEVKFGTITDKELASYKIESYARAFGITLKALVNDDMGVLADLSAKMTRGARRWFAGFLVDTIISNPKLADNKAVFHADHGNLATSGAVISETTLSAGKLAMRTQIDLSGNPIDAMPRFILSPAALELTVDQLLATLYPQQPSDAVVAARNLTPIIEPRLDAKGQMTSWYLFSDPAGAPVFEYSELSGYEGPRVDVRQGFETLGTEIRVVWHVGAGAIDHRGAWKNAGA
ncbi:MAG: HK97 family phage prohead protease [Bryobacteraceae bacterium]